MGVEDWRDQSTIVDRGDRQSILRGSFSHRVALEGLGSPMARR
jgi:hypothetical protein